MLLTAIGADRRRRRRRGGRKGFQNKERNHIKRRRTTSLLGDTKEKIQLNPWPGFRTGNTYYPTKRRRRRKLVHYQRWRLALGGIPSQGRLVDVCVSTREA